MKNQTPRLNVKTVNTSFTRSRHEIYERRQPESSGGTDRHN